MLNDRNPRRALTLIEMLVVISIVSILLALIVPAVQYSREASRRATCAANLHNIGLAIHRHVEGTGKLPAGSGEKANESSLVQILTYLYQVNLFNSINFSPLSFVDFGPANLTAGMTRVSAFYCPSDANRTDFFASTAANYAGNIGRESDGASIDRPLRDAEISDGLSGTVGVSEWIVGPGSVERGPRLGAIFSLADGASAGTLPEFRRSCSEIDDRSARVSVGYKGRWWLKGMAGITLYNHTMTPNQPSCLSNRSPRFTAITAGSLHGRGAHSLMMDGSVRFVPDSIDGAVWLALGTRAGSEILPQN